MVLLVVVVLLLLLLLPTLLRPAHLDDHRDAFQKLEDERRRHIVAGAGHQLDAAVLFFGGWRGDDAGAAA
jgi:hypothetical protein